MRHSLCQSGQPIHCPLSGTADDLFPGSIVHFFATRPSLLMVKPSHSSRRSTWRVCAETGLTYQPLISRQYRYFCNTYPRPPTSSNIPIGFSTRPINVVYGLLDCMRHVCHMYYHGFKVKQVSRVLLASCPRAFDIKMGCPHYSAVHLINLLGTLHGQTKSCCLACSVWSPLWQLHCPNHLQELLTTLAITFQRHGTTHKLSNRACCTNQTVSYPNCSITSATD